MPRYERPSWREVVGAVVLVLVGAVLVAELVILHMLTVAEKVVLR